MGVTNELDNNVCDSTMYKVDNDKCYISDEYVLENFDNVDEEEVKKSLPSFLTRLVLSIHSPPGC